MLSLKPHFFDKTKQERWENNTHKQINHNNKYNNTNIDDLRLAGHEIFDRVYLSDERRVGADVVITSTTVTSQQLAVCLYLENIPMLADKQQVKIVA